MLAPFRAPQKAFVFLIIPVIMKGIIKSNIIFKDSPALSKASVLYMIENAAATTAITITLHADAYARLAEDSEIIAALEAQPLVTLVSA